MIKINDYIFNENEIIHMGEVGWSEARRIEVITKNNKIYYIDDVHIRDIEWNYGTNKNNKLKEEYITLEKDYGTCEIENGKLRDKIKELEEELEEEKKGWKDMLDSRDKLVNRIGKAIEYIVTNREPVDERDGEVLFWLSDEFNEEKLLKILKGEE